MQTAPSLVRQILRDPVEGAKTLVALRLPMSALWSGLLAAAAIDAIVSTLWTARFLSLYAEELPPDLAEAMASAAAAPIWNAVLQALYWYLAVHLLHRVGKAFGGRGDLQDSLHVTLAIQAAYVGLLFILLMFLLVVPVLVGPVMLAGLVGAVWLASGLIRGLHGFSSRLGILVVATPILLVVYLSMAIAAEWLFGPTR